MFRVEADSLAGCFDFDPRRTADLKKLDALIRNAAPNLKRYFFTRAHRPDSPECALR